MKHFIVRILIVMSLLVLVGVGILMYRLNHTNYDMYSNGENGTTVPFEEAEAILDQKNERIQNPDIRDTPALKIKADVFSGTLGKVDTGCFADGECFVEVDGRHVTALMGWNGDTVGMIQGVPSFGDLENYIGKNVEVYAQEKIDGTYTLYGSEGFYIKLTGSSGRATSTLPKLTGSCVAGGCSGQLCVDASDADEMVTTCEYRSEYACYQKAQCTRQTNGQCGWTETGELTACLQAKPTTEEKLEVI